MTDRFHVVLAENAFVALEYVKLIDLKGEWHIVDGVRSIEGLRFRYEDVLRVPGWWKNPEIEEIEERILRTHVAHSGLADIRFHERGGVDWDIDANLPTYTRDFLKMIKDGTLEYPLCTYGTVTH